MIHDRPPEPGGPTSQPAARPVVRLRFDKFSAFVQEYASYLSLGGLFVTTSELRPVGQVVDLEVELGDGFRLIQGVAEVAWLRSEAAGADRPAGMALRFQALDEQGRELILKILEEQVKSGGEPFDVDEVPADAEAAVSSSAPPTGPVAAGDERHLDFRAPWGRELPEIPQEILLDLEPEASAAGWEEPGLRDDEPPEPAGLSFDLAVEAAWDLEPLPEVAEMEPEGDSAIVAGVPISSAGREPTTAPSEALQAPEPVFDFEPEAAAADVSPAPDSIERPAAGSGPAGDDREAERHAAIPAPPVAESETAATEPAVAAFGEEIPDDEDDLFRRAAPEGHGARSSRLAGIRGPLAILVLLVASAAFYFRQPLARLAGLTAPAAGEVPAATVPPPAAETPEKPAPAVGTEVAPSGFETRPAADGVPASLGDADPRPPQRQVAGSTDPDSPRLRSPTAARPAAAEPSPPRPPAVPATRLVDVTWRATGGGTEVTLVLDGALEDRRIVHDRLGWAADREQLTLTGIDTPYRPAEVPVGTSELKRIRSGLHAAGGGSELRLVFDFAFSDARITDLESRGERIRLFVRRSGP